MASEMRLQETQAGTTEYTLMRVHRPGAYSHCCRALVLTWTLDLDQAGTSLRQNRSSQLDSCASSQGGGPMVAHGAVTWTSTVRPLTPHSHSTDPREGERLTPRALSLMVKPPFVRREPRLSPEGLVQQERFRSQSHGGVSPRAAVTF